MAGATHTLVLVSIITWNNHRCPASGHFISRSFMVAGYYSLELEAENFQHPGITGHHVGVADTNGFPFRRNCRLSRGIDGE